MWTPEEKEFLDYWTANRDRKRKVMRQLYAGLPLAAILVGATVVTAFSGWYQRAGMVMKREQSSLVLVLLIAVLLITVFIVIFSARHRWDMQEQRYRELLARKEEEPPAAE
jgi:cation transporter-like permease